MKIHKWSCWSILIFFSVFNQPYTAYSVNMDESVRLIKKGEPAPFEGLLYTIGYAAELRAELESWPKKLELEKLHQESLFKLQLELKINELNMKLRLSENELNYTKQMVDVYKKEAEREPPWYKDQTLWFIIGLGAGGIITVGLAWGLNQAGK